MPSPKLGGAAIAVLASLTAAPAVAQDVCPVEPKRVDDLLPASEPYSLEAVLAAVRAASPEVRSAALEAVAQRHEARQAGLWTNPVLSVEAENFAGEAIGGSNPLTGYDFAETTVSVGQTFRLGGKRRAERRAALARAALAEADRDATLRALEREAASVFYELAAADQAAALAEEAAALSEQLADAVGARVEAGKSPGTAMDRAIAARADAQAAAAAARAQAEGLSFALSSFWGDSEPARIRSTDLLAPIALPSPEIVAERVRDHPERRFAEADREARFAERRAARANAYP
uniref:TolC family protein n=1 Tax=Parvularcula oceani TaxID=1247963 RepID=UPI00138E416C